MGLGSGGARSSGGEGGGGLGGGGLGEGAGGEGDGGGGEGEGGGRLGGDGLGGGAWVGAHQAAQCPYPNPSPKPNQVGLGWGRTRQHGALTLTLALSLTRWGLGGGAPGSTVPLPSKPRSSVFISPLNSLVGELWKDAAAALGTQQVRNKCRLAAVALTLTPALFLALCVNHRISSPPAPGEG